MIITHDGFNLFTLHFCSSQRAAYKVMCVRDVYSSFDGRGESLSEDDGLLAKAFNDSGYSV